MQVLKEDIRGRILAVAKLQFGQKGYSKTSMREIAELAGVGVGNIYNYFASKDELFGEVVRPVMHALEAMLQEHHGIRGEDVMRMKSEKYLKACIDEYVSLLTSIVPCWRFCCFAHKALCWNIFVKATPTAPRNWSRHGSHPCSGNTLKSIRRCPISSSTCIRYGCSPCLRNCLCIQYPNKKWKPSCTITSYLKSKAGGQSSRYERQKTYIRATGHITMAGKEESFTEVSSFFYEQF